MDKRFNDFEPTGYCKTLKQIWLNVLDNFKRDPTPEGVKMFKYCLDRYLDVYYAELELWMLESDEA